MLTCACVISEKMLRGALKQTCILAQCTLDDQRCTCTCRYRDVILFGISIAICLDAMRMEDVRGLGRQELKARIFLKVYASS